MISPHTLTAKKQSGKSFTYSEIEFIVNGYTSCNISDDEMTAWLKAIVDHGMNQEETLHYTRTMLMSGTQLDFSHLNGFVIDKHSTGGVGDKVSIVLAPLLAACGCYIPMLAGRGLEHTGGTIDKLDTIPGYQTTLNIHEFMEVVGNVGLSIMAQTHDICPADMKIYALRDVTNTVASFPLICGSIMSKKIAEGIQGLVLDIKVGNGAFMKTEDDARKLGSLLKEVGEMYGLKVSVCLTGMSQPLGNAVGLWCEIMESMECLKGNGPNDIMNVVYYLGDEALKIAGIQNRMKKLKDSISDGSALNKFKELVQAHGGSLECLDDHNMHKPSFIKKVYAKTDGYISFIDTLNLGMILVHLGGGRLLKTENLDPTVGINLHKKIGDEVHTGDILLEYFCSDKDKFNNAKLYINQVFQIKSIPHNTIKLIYN